MTYLFCKKLIVGATYTEQAQKDEMQMKLDVFLLNNRITQAQYTELTTMLSEKEITA